MATPIVLVASGGLPVTQATLGAPFTPVSDGGFPVTLVDSGGLPVNLVNVDGSAYSVGPDVTAPTIASASAISLAENTALSHTLSANEIVTWTITGGADSALFSIAGNTLSLSAQDYETPADADANNTYVVQVTATDSAGNASNQTITVTVTDVAEGGSSAGEPIGAWLFLFTRAA